MKTRIAFVTLMLALAAPSAWCRLKDYPPAGVFGVYTGIRAGWTTTVGSGGALSRERTTEAVSFRLDKNTFTGRGYFAPIGHEKAYNVSRRGFSSAPTKTLGVIHFAGTIPNPKTKVPETRVYMVTITLKRDSRTSPTYRLVVDHLEYAKGGPIYSHYRTTAWQRK